MLGHGFFEAGCGFVGDQVEGFEFVLFFVHEVVV